MQANLSLHLGPSDATRPSATQTSRAQPSQLLLANSILTQHQCDHPLHRTPLDPHLHVKQRLAHNMCGHAGDSLADVAFELLDGLTMLWSCALHAVGDVLPREVVESIEIG